MRNVHEPVIGDDDHHGRGIDGELLARQPRDHAVDGFEIGAGFRTEGPMGVLRIVQRAQVQCHEAGLVNLRRISNA